MHFQTLSWHMVVLCCCFFDLTSPLRNAKQRRQQYWGICVSKVNSACSVHGLIRAVPTNKLCHSFHTCHVMQTMHINYILNRCFFKINFQPIHCLLSTIIYLLHIFISFGFAWRHSFLYKKTFPSLFSLILFAKTLLFNSNTTHRHFTYLTL